MLTQRFRAFGPTLFVGLWLLWGPVASEPARAAIPDPETAGYVAVEGGRVWYRINGIEHLAFYVDTREEVDAAYQRCLDIGARIHFPPEEDRDIEGFYELFVFDPDGLRVEVACAPPGWFDQEKAPSLG